MVACIAVGKPGYGGWRGQEGKWGIQCKDPRGYSTESKSYTVVYMQLRQLYIFLETVIRTVYSVVFLLLFYLWF